MARLILEGCTLEQADILAHWYINSGEQNAQTYFECQDEEIEAPISCVGPKNKFTEVNKKEETVTLWVK